MEHRHRQHGRTKPEADNDQHQGEAQPHPHHMRHGQTHPEIHARGQQHHVIRPWRDRGNKGEADKGDELLRIHVSILLQFIGKYVENKAINIVIGAIHVQT